MNYFNPQPGFRFTSPHYHELYKHSETPRLFFGHIEKNKRSKSWPGVLILSTIAGDKDVKILLADDDADDRDLFQEAIAELTDKIELEVVKDGLQLMEFLNAEEAKLPDVIFLDLNMPGKDGKQCLKEIRKHKTFKSIPVVIYTTTNSLRDIEETHSLGANLFVRKPTSYREMVQITRTIATLNWEDHQPNPSRKSYVFALTK